MAWSTPPTFSAGATLGASQLNILSGDLNVLGGAWTSDARSAATIWTAATTNPVIGNGSLTSRYRSVGKTFDWEVRIVTGSTTTYGTGTWQLVPPFAPLLTGGEYPVGAVLDTSAPARFGLWAIKGSVFSLQTSLTAGALSSVNSTTPMTWNTGDELTFLFTACEGA